MSRSAWFVPFACVLLWAPQASAFGAANGTDPEPTTAPVGFGIGMLGGAMVRRWHPVHERR